MKVTVNYDTVTKKLEVVKDGEKMERVSNVSFYCWNCGEEEAEAMMEIRQYEDNYKENGTFTSIVTTAEQRESIAKIMGL